MGPLQNCLPFRSEGGSHLTGNIGMGPAADGLSARSGSTGDCLLPSEKIGHHQRSPVAEFCRRWVNADGSRWRSHSTTQLPSRHNPR
jgi:hypothetical protein